MTSEESMGLDEDAEDYDMDAVYEDSELAEMVARLVLSHKIRE
jgi:hypothetical protein